MENDSMKRKMMKSSSLSSMLHDNLVIEILLRLPVKSLMRFNCVNQCWKALITTSSSFITSYNNHNINMKNERAIAFLYDVNHNPPRCIFKRLSDDKYEDLTNPFLQIDPSAEEEESQIRPCGSYKGVFCLYRIYSNYDRCQIILWNPATRKVKAIPPPPSLSDYFLSVHDYYGDYYSVMLICGFGGDPNTNDLVIVNLIVVDTRQKGHPNPYAEIYNLTTNSWTLISSDNVPGSVGPVRQGSTYADGVCHWLSGIGTPEACILCFHFRNNQFTRLELPPQTINIDEGVSLAEINDSIAYVVPCLLLSSGFRIWVFERNSNCWSQNYNFVGPIDCPLNQWPSHIFTVWRNGTEFLGLSREKFRDEYFRMFYREKPGRLVLYNSDGQPLHHFDFEDTIKLYYDICYFYYIHKYVENITPISFFPSS